MSSGKRLAGLQILILAVAIVFAWVIKPKHDLKFVDFTSEKPPWFFVVNPNQSVHGSILCISEFSEMKDKINNIDIRNVVLSVSDRDQYINKIKEQNKINSVHLINGESVNLFSFVVENQASRDLVTIRVGPPYAYGVRYEIANNRILPVDWFRLNSYRSEASENFRWLSVSMIAWLALAIGAMVISRKK